MHYTERFMRIADYLCTVPCGTCGKPAERVFISSGAARDAQPIAPVIVYRKSDGGYIYPGDSGPRSYEGAQRVELRTLGELRAVAREQDRQDREHWEVTQYREESVNGPARAARRAHLLSALETNFGKDFARHAIEQNEARRQGKRFSPANSFEVAEYDRSNREPQYDQSTGWKGRHG